jgi:ATP phosphoribosyltransferase regulatory subunit
MSAFPNTHAARIKALSDQADAILGVFGSHGYDRAEPSVLQPADIFLDRSGEEIRRRTFAFTDPAGNELCLRPDLTIPICRMVVEEVRAMPTRLCYNGLAFRHQPAEPERPTQFYQAGVELLGHEDRAAAEIEILTLAVQSMQAAGLHNVTMKIGDLGLFSNFIDALSIPPQWRARLKRHFWRPGYFEALLKGEPQSQPSDARALLAHLGTLGENDARSAFEGLMDMIGGGPGGARTREEIVDRLMEQAADAAALRLDPKIAELVGKLLAVSGPAETALNDVRALTKEAGVTLEAPLAAMEARLAALKKLGLDAGSISFAARFGRNMEYYTGFVFELWSKDAEGPVQIAGGGRYDTLLQNLGAAKAIPAIGYAIRTERVLAARLAQDQAGDA